MAIEFGDTDNQEQSPAVRKLKDRLSNFETAEGRLRGINEFKPCPNDIVITTSPKCGTTWMQQICHQVRSASGTLPNMDFHEIGEVVPWIELAHDLGQNLNDSQSTPNNNIEDEDDTRPRLFKTHCWAEHCPPFQRVIVVVRDPRDVLVSFHKFFEGWFFEPGEIALEEFAREFWLARGTPDHTKMQNASYFVHLVSWFRRKFHIQKQDRAIVDTDPGILFVCYEDLRDDLVGEIARVVAFMRCSRSIGTSVTDIAKLVAPYCTYDFMKQHESKFDEKLTKLARNVACSLHPQAGMQHSKIHGGLSGHGKVVLPNSIQSAIISKWSQIVEPVTGCKTYEELRALLKKGQQSLNYI